MVPYKKDLPLMRPEDDNSTNGIEEGTDFPAEHGDPPSRGSNGVSLEVELLPLSKGIRFIDAWRLIYSEIHAQTITVFLNVAANPGLSMTKLALLSGIAQSSVSRNVAILSRWDKPNKAGLNLLEAQDNPQNRREKIVYLTAKGARFLQTLLSTLG